MHRLAADICANYAWVEFADPLPRTSQLLRRGPGNTAIALSGLYAKGYLSDALLSTHMVKAFSQRFFDVLGSVCPSSSWDSYPIDPGGLEFRGSRKFDHRGLIVRNEIDGKSAGTPWKGVQPMSVMPDELRMEQLGIALLRETDVVLISSSVASAIQDAKLKCICLIELQKV